MKKRIDLYKGDITALVIDAIVNAANPMLIPGGGVDGAIHIAAGRELATECKKLKGCKPGEAKITSGYRLKAKHVIHTVGPVWRGGNSGETEILALCYRNSLLLAVEKGIKTIAFPSISTGVYGYPLNKAVTVAVNEVVSFLRSDDSIEKVIFVCFSENACKEYTKALTLLGGCCIIHFG